MRTAPCMILAVLLADPGLEEVVWEGRASDGSTPHGSVGAACPPWAFGPGCSEECRCVQSHTRSCDKRDGSCSCKAGFQGERCQAGESTRGVWGAPGPADPTHPSLTPCRV